MLASSSSKSVDLLVSWEAERSTIQPDTNEVSKESILTASVLDGGQLWSGKASDVSGLVWGGSPEPSLWGLCLLREVIAHSTDSVLIANCHKWCNSLTHCLQKTKDASILASVFTTISSLIYRLHSTPQLSHDFSSSSLPGLMNSLLWFTAAPPPCQIMAITVVTQCVVYFHSGCSQYRAQLRKWALTGLFNGITQLSQECSRLLVLLCLSNSQEWTTLIQKTLSALHFALSSAYKPVLSKGLTFDLSYFNPTPLPLEEPSCSAALLQQVNVFSRTLCYALLFPPRSTAGSPGVPLQRILGVISFGLSVYQQQVSAHSTEALLLYSILPLIHTALWTILATLIDCCQHHLLPYSSHIESAIVQEITAAHQNSPSLLLAVFRALVAWVTVRRDCELGFLSIVVRSLLTSINIKTSTPTDNREVRLSGLRALSTLVDCCASILPPSLCSLISQGLPMNWISHSPTTNDEETLAYLKLLLGSVTASNSALAPPLSKAIHVFSEQCSMNKSSKVKEFCQSALVQCSLLQHPNAVPILPLHHSDITTNGTHQMDHSTTVSNQHYTPELLTNRDPLMRERTIFNPIVPATSSAQLLTCVSPSIADEQSTRIQSPKRPPSSQLEEALNKQVRLGEENEMAIVSVPVINDNQETAVSSQQTSRDIPQSFGGSMPSTVDDSPTLSTIAGNQLTTTAANGQHHSSLAPMGNQSLPTMTISDHEQQTRNQQLHFCTNYEQEPHTMEPSAVPSQYTQQQLGEFLQMSSTGGESSEEDEDVKCFIDAPPDNMEY